MANVAVIMSTYNGELYLREQINSILKQKNVTIDLYIRDDGSTDFTWETLQQISIINKNVYVIQGTNIGVGNSFMELLYSIDRKYDFYAFADQDDIWLPIKLSAGIQKMERVQGCVLYVSNQVVTDCNLQNRKIRFLDPPYTNYGEMIRGNLVSGCTFIFNNSLYEFLVDRNNRPSPEVLRARIHDVWVAVMAALFGIIIYDSEPYILYRQHDRNVVGVRDELLLNKYRLKIKRLFCKDLCLGGSILANEILRLFSDRLGEKKKIIYSYAIYRNSLKSKIDILFMHNVFRHTGENIWIYSLKVMLGRL